MPSNPDPMTILQEAKAEDWAYLEKLLFKSIRGPDDWDTKFWLLAVHRLRHWHTEVKA